MDREKLNSSLHNDELEQLANIEKQINQTLNSFEIERQKQTMEVQKIKQDIEHMNHCQSAYRQLAFENKEKERAFPDKPDIDYSVGLIQTLQKEKKDLLNKFEAYKRSKKSLKEKYIRLKEDSSSRLKENDYKVEDLEIALKNSNNRIKELEKFIDENEPNELRKQLRDAEDSSREQDVRYKENMKRANEDVEDALSKIRSKDDEDQNQSNVVNKILTDILKDASLNCDFLSNINFTLLSIPQKLSNLEKLVKYLFCEKEYSDKKYNKLMELHNEAIEINNKACSKFTPEAFRKLTEENNELKRQIGQIKNWYANKQHKRRVSEVR